jgi:acetolactate synthase-1/2/3 large subunit
LKKTGAQIIVDYLIQEGVEYVFGITGHGCLPVVDALRIREKEGKIKFIHVKQEMSGVHMADGYFRVTGKPLAVLTSIGPGALNTLIGLGTAFVDSTSVLVLMGDTHTNMRGVGVLQEIERKHDSDFLSTVRPVTKRCWRAENVIQLPRILRRAFNTMKTGRKGPVAISLPMDVQADSLELGDNGLAANTYSEYGGGRPEDIAKAFEIMKSAKRPVIVAGGGAYYARAHNELIQLCEKWGAAVVTTMASKSCFPEDHPLYGWHGGSKGTEVGNYLCRTADVVLALGARFADESTSSYRKGVTYNFPDTKLIQVDIEPGEIGKNYPSTVGILGDLKLVIKQLIDEFDKNGFSVDYKNTEYYKDIVSHREDWFEKLKKQRDIKTDALTISQFVGRLNEIYPEDGIIVTSSGNSQAQIFQEYCFKKPGTLVTTGGFSTMGFAMPAAMGIKLAKPDTPVMTVVGDGDFMMCMQEMSTMAQYNIPVVTVVLNNMGWMAINDLQRSAYGYDHAFGNDFITADGNVYSPDFAKVAENFGLFAKKVTNYEEIKDAVLECVNSGKPSLIEVIVSRTFPYSGGESTGWWDVPTPFYVEGKYEEFRDAKKEEYLK